MKAHHSAREASRGTRQAPRGWHGLEPYLLLGPGAIVVSAVIVYPALYTVLLSLYDYNLLRPSEVGFVGLRNYLDLLSDSQFWHTVLRTVLYTAGSVALSFLLGLGSALVLNTRFPGRGLARVLCFLPWAVPWLVTTLIWKSMLDPQIGPVNVVFKALGLISEGVPWLFLSSTAMLTVIAVTAWKYVPMATMMILAGLQGISPELYQAASVDGANGWQRFVHITLPGIKTVNAITILLLSMWIFKLFTIVYVMTGGGPGDSTLILPVLVYDQAFTYYEVGLGAACAVLILIITLGIVTLYRRLTKVG